MAIGVAAVALAGERSADEVSRITRQVSQEIYSPYCPGQTLAMCPSSNASVARQNIQKMAEQGKDAEEIKQELLRRYGDEFALIEPPRRDQMSLLGGIVAGLAVAAFAVGFLARRRSDDDGDSTDDDAGDSRGPDDDPEADEFYLQELRAEYRD